MNERIMILEMIKDGKISVDDGVKLLNAVNKNSSSSFEDFTNDIKYKFNNIPKPDAQKIKQNTKEFFNKTEEVFDDLTKSIKDFFTQNEKKDYDSSNDDRSNDVINLNSPDFTNYNDNKNNVNDINNINNNNFNDDNNFNDINNVNNNNVNNNNFNNN